MSNTPLVYEPVSSLNNLSLMRCTACAALVDPSNLGKHNSWHDQVRPGGSIEGPPGPRGPKGDPGDPSDLTTLADVVTTHVMGLLADLSSQTEIKRIQYWIDGLYVLLGEDPPFKPDWEEDRT